MLGPDTVNLSGGENNDHVHGGSDNGWLLDAGGSKHLIGGYGDDTLIGGAGIGGAGDNARNGGFYNLDFEAGEAIEFKHSRVSGDVCLGFLDIQQTDDDVTIDTGRQTIPVLDTTLSDVTDALVIA
ncbi:hypothetical protein [Falsiphaeobacter marinintestinus]|uniref:hypothetical protein n=1 Tax=Falsiphaeobacter marinintestinus TaxID=1492905 RepID=UPI0011B53AE4|nr:hypothetical protein [Phaeobacter marinintestinus]